MKTHFLLLLLICISHLLGAQVTHNDLSTRKLIFQKKDGNVNLFDMSGKQQSFLKFVHTNYLEETLGNYPINFIDRNNDKTFTLLDSLGLTTQEGTTTPIDLLLNNIDNLLNAVGEIQFYQNYNSEKESWETYFIEAFVLVGDSQKIPVFNCITQWRIDDAEFQQKIKQWTTSSLGQSLFVSQTYIMVDYKQASYNSSTLTSNGTPFRYRIIEGDALKTYKKSEGFNFTSLWSKAIQEQLLPYTIFSIPTYFEGKIPGKKYVADLETSKYFTNSQDIPYNELIQVDENGQEMYQLVDGVERPVYLLPTLTPYIDADLYYILLYETYQLNPTTNKMEYIVTRVCPFFYNQDRKIGMSSQNYWYDITDLENAFSKLTKNKLPVWFFALKNNTLEGEVYSSFGTELKSYEDLMKL